jgi:hypothetical protein
MNIPNRRLSFIAEAQRDCGRIGFCDKSLDHEGNLISFSHGEILTYIFY